MAKKKTTNATSAKSKTVTDIPAKKQTTEELLKEVIEATSTSAPIATPTPKPSKSKSSGPRVLAPAEPRFPWLHRKKRVKPTEIAKVPSSFKVFKETLLVLRDNWKILLGLTLIYGVLTVILVPAVSGTDLSGAKTNFEQAIGGHLTGLSTGFSALALMASDASSANTQVAGIYRFLLVFLMSMVFIWTYRQIYAKKKIHLRDSFYQSMYPLVPMLLVLLVAVIQVAPLAITAYIYSLVAANGGGASGGEMLVWGAVTLVAGVLSAYFVSSTIFALYIVCLPGMRPMAAIRSARELVRFRRWTILRRVLFLPLVLFVLSSILVVPMVLIVPSIAGWAFILFLILALPISHAYLYRLYRGLL